MNLDKIKVVVFDLDGTIYYGSKIIPGANETISFFRKKGKKVYFATNNSTKTRRQIFEKLRKMDVNCEEGEVLTSGFLAAINAKKHRLKNVYIFGSENLRQEFEKFGISLCQNDSAENILIGYDPKMTYEKLTDALQVALKAKCIMACNRERMFPGENAKLMPGCGAMTAPIEWCANRECDYIIGKPNTLMMELLSEIESVSNEEILMIGDTYESDIIMANVAGCQSILIGKSIHGALSVSKIGEVPGLFD